MPMREKDRKLRRRQRRRRKLHKLKAKLEKAQTSTTRRELLEKIRRLDPWFEMPGQKIEAVKEFDVDPRLAWRCGQ